MVARQKISRNEWETTEIGAFEVGQCRTLFLPCDVLEDDGERGPDGLRGEDEARRGGVADEGVPRRVDEGDLPGTKKSSAARIRARKRATRARAPTVVVAAIVTTVKPTPIQKVAT